jgi:tetratricopeptide (TPR) repeat protein
MRFLWSAFRQQGFHDAAHEALKEALRSRSRAAPIRHLALSERAENYLVKGKKAMARKDLERILAEDSDDANVREWLEELMLGGLTLASRPHRADCDRRGGDGYVLRDNSSLLMAHLLPATARPDEVLAVTA